MGSTCFYFEPLENRWRVAQQQAAERRKLQQAASSPKYSVSVSNRRPCRRQQTAGIRLRIKIGFINSCAHRLRPAAKSCPAGSAGRTYEICGKNDLPKTATAPEMIFAATMGCSGLDVQRSFRSALWAGRNFVTVVHAVSVDMSHSSRRSCCDKFCSAASMLASTLQTPESIILA